jgi:hypothetical protein
MAVFSMFSKRQQPISQEASDVFRYDEIPHELRIQLLHALDDARHRIYQRTIPEYWAIGTEGMDIFATACMTLRRELGLGRLVDVRKRVRTMADTETRDLCNEFTVFFENCEPKHVLDSVEIIMHFIKEAEQSGLLDDECNASTVTDEINTRFLGHRVGFQYQSGQIVVQTNKLLHSDVTTPALTLLGDPVFTGANEEFLKAHEHYRYGRYSECLIDCNKAFESTMKIVCELRKWPYATTDTAKNLIDVCLTNDLVPTFTQQQLTSLRTLLESGIPTIRNKKAGHGQGVDRHDVSPQLARFALHLTGAAIVLLVESHKADSPS